MNKTKLFLKIAYSDIKDINSCQNNINIGIKYIRSIASFRNTVFMFRNSNLISDKEKYRTEQHK
jgi:hypothetical protein